MKRLEAARDKAITALALLGEEAYSELKRNAGRLGYQNIMALQAINQVTANCVGSIAGLTMPDYEKQPAERELT